MSNDKRSGLAHYRIDRMDYAGVEFNDCTLVILSPQIEKVQFNEFVKKI